MKGAIINKLYQTTHHTCFKFIFIKQASLLSSFYQNLQKGKLARGWNNQPGVSGILENNQGRHSHLMPETFFRQRLWFALIYVHLLSSILYNLKLGNNRSKHLNVWIQVLTSIQFSWFEGQSLVEFQDLVTREGDVSHGPGRGTSRGGSSTCQQGVWA